ncbi:VOC family protein [candidate division FCPU426 bacterium]|nr:VOC family protein [candidate division FCPU426 bacterium]
MESRICLHHICVRVSNLNQSEMFYGGFLGLKKLYAFTVQAEDARVLFNLPSECRFLTFECPEGGGLELFQTEGNSRASAGCHFCLGVYNREPLLEKLRQAQVTIRETVREDRRIVFVLDPDDNLIELKELEG